MSESSFSDQYRQTGNSSGPHIRHTPGYAEDVSGQAPPYTNADAPSDAQQGLWDDYAESNGNDAFDASQGLSGVSEAPTGRSNAIPAGAKRPQDRRKPAKRQIVVDGMDLTIDVGRLQDDWELMEMMAEMEGSGEEENLPLVIKMVKAVVGDQYGKVKQHCLSDDGSYVSSEKMIEVVKRVFEEVGELGE